MYGTKSVSYIIIYLISSDRQIKNIVSFLIKYLEVKFWTRVKFFKWHLKIITYEVDIFYRMSNGLWLDMNIVQLLMGFLSPSHDGGIQITRRDGYYSYATTNNGDSFYRIVYPNRPLNSHYQNILFVSSTQTTFVKFTRCYK